MQDYFKSVFSTPMSNIDLTNFSSFIPQINHALPDLSITLDDIINAIDELKTTSACPKFCVPAIIFKRCKFSMAKPLKLFWEESFRLGEIPDAYKVQQITPLHKKGSKTSAAHFRPIVLSPHEIKTFERVMRKKLVEYLESNNIINKNQHGFRKNCSCLSQLLSHCNFILDEMSRGNEVDTIYVDYAKAFDKVDHGILLEKLKLYGINGKYHAWLTSFLKGRKQFVYLNNAYSYETEVASGVPQGSVLGPLLFVIYINDMVHLINSSQLQTFADDTKIAHQITSVQDKNSLQEDLNVIKKWSNSNNMELNENKFELICHRWKFNGTINLLKELPFFDENFTYRATNNVILYPTATVRDLGVIVDPLLDWESHISKITLDCRRLSGWVLNVFITRDRQTMMLLFNSLIRSRLEFCCELWDPYLIKNISKIEQVQRRFTSKVDEGKDLNYWDRLKLFNLLSLQRRRERQTIIYAWKIKNDLVRQGPHL